MVRLRVSENEEYWEVTKKMGADEARSFFATTASRSLGPPKERRGASTTDKPADIERHGAD